MKAELEAIRDEEQDAFDNMPEGLQQSERGEASEEAIRLIDDALESIETATENIDEVAGG
ncbi:hypothetical protein D3C85_1932520 [compost metagenome]